MRSSYLFLLLLLTSCGYHFGKTSNFDKISVILPYIKDDFSGLFTNELIKQISYSSNMEYKYINADYILNVTIVDSSTSQIGYKYDRDNQNIRKKNIRATEGRLTVTAKIEIIASNTNETRFGPFNVSADADFDYVDPDSLNDLSFQEAGKSKRTPVLSFSLGQLESIESAKEAALKPLYEKLSKKIVDAISTYW